MGLFLHWDVSSVKGINIGWSVIPGRRIAARREKFSPEEVRRIQRRKLVLGCKDGSLREAGKRCGVSLWT